MVARRSARIGRSISQSVWHAGLSTQRCSLFSNRGPAQESPCCAHDGTTPVRGTAIRETSDIRNWLLRALNVRTNHVHAVISTAAHPDLVLNALKANATRQLRQDRCWEDSRSPWSDGGSRRYVWTEAGLQRAIDYVINGQDGDAPENLR